MIFIDAIRVKVREGTVTNRPIYIALAVTAEGMREILGIWAGEPGEGEGAKYWLRVLTEIRNRGVKDTLIVVYDGLKGLPESIEVVWPEAQVQRSAGPNLHRSPAQVHLPLRRQAGLGRAAPGPETGLPGRPGIDTDR